MPDRMARSPVSSLESELEDRLMTGRVWRFAALPIALASAAAGLLVLLPVYTGFDGSRTTYAMLIEVNGAWVILPLFFPVAMTLLPLIFQARLVRIAATILLVIFVLVSGFSIGLFYVPAAILMLLTINSSQTPSDPGDPAA